MFQVVVLNVRSKTVVVIIENVALEPDRFPDLLGSTGEILKTLRFRTAPIRDVIPNP